MRDGIVVQISRIVRSMAALKRITSLTRALATMTSASRSCLQRASRKTYFTYVNEPSMPIPGKEPCWLKTADEAIEQAELDSGKTYPAKCFFSLFLFSKKKRCSNYDPSLPPHRLTTLQPRSTNKSISPPGLPRSFPSLSFSFSLICKATPIKRGNYYVSFQHRRLI